MSSPTSSNSILLERRRGSSPQEESSRRFSSGAVDETGPVAFRRLPDKSVLQPMALLSIGLKEVAMLLASRGNNLMQINRSILRGSYANIGDYVALTKPRVMSLVVF